MRHFAILNYRNLAALATLVLKRMKQCPVCEKTFEDNMRFCQSDGTPLVDKIEPVDPFKTMVASKADIAAAIPKSDPAPPIPEPSVPAPIENEVLEIPPANDPNKTQFVSEAELRAEMDAHSSDDNVIDIAPATESAANELPITGDPQIAPPPSPFSTPNSTDDEPGPANFPTSPPIPSPFNAMPVVPELASTPDPDPPAPQFSEPAEPEINPFEPPPAAPMAQAELNPPSSPEPNMQNPQNFGQQPFNAPPAAGGGQNSTLAIISLVAGILGLTLCCGTLIPSVVAVITGFMARGKANNDPAHYGGAGLALGGLITGVLGLLGSVIVLIYVLLNFAMVAAMMAGQ